LPRSSNSSPDPIYQIAQRAGREHVVRPSECAHAGADVHRDSANVVAADLAVSGVQSGAHTSMPSDCTASRIDIAQRIAR